MKVLKAIFVCLLISSCKSQIFSGFQSPFPAKLYPPWIVKVQNVPQTFEAVHQQKTFVPCTHHTFPIFGTPYDKNQLNNPCPTVQLKSSPKSGKMVIAKVAQNNFETSSSIPTTQKTTTAQPIELTTIIEVPLMKVSSFEAPSRDYSVIFKSKCKEYSELTIELQHFGGLMLNPVLTNVSAESCDITGGLITGGIKANPKEFPHMAAIAYQDKNGKLAFACGGSLISDQFVLTAAHCDVRNNNEPASMVRLGAFDLNENHGHDYKIDDFISHEAWDPSTRQNDIAVIKLEKRLSFDLPKLIRPACLWLSESLKETKAIATGYGASRFGGQMISSLMKVRLDILDNDRCAKYFAGDEDEDYRDGDVIISDKQLCIGSYESGKDTCQGDSGGPVQIAVDNQPCVSHIIGVTSFGDKVCGGDNAPAVYTRVSAYIDWIGSKVFP